MSEVAMVDIDGTLGDFLAAALPIFTHHFGNAPSWETADSLPHLGIWYENHGISRGQWYSAFKRWEGDIYMELPSYPKAREALTDWRRMQGAVFYLTARPVRYNALTIKWLTTHGFPIAPVLSGVPPHKKWQIAQRWKATVLVDDSPQVLNSAQSAGFSGRLVAVDHGYNHTVPAKNRVSWVTPPDPALRTIGMRQVHHMP